MRHLRQLDGMRGIAALIVFGWHATTITRTMPWILAVTRLTPFGVLFSGAAAVAFFFVLSGFVLNLTYTAIETYPPRWWVEFIVKRVFRIYPAYVVVIVAAAAMKFAGRGASDPFSRTMLQDWYITYWNEHFTLSDVLRTVAMAIPAAKARVLDAPIWSLLVEMRISMIFPLVILACNGRRKLVTDLLLLVCAYVACYLTAFRLGVATVAHLPHFVLGALLAKRWGQIEGLKLSMAPRELGRWTSTLLVGSVALCCLGALAIAAEEGSGGIPMDTLPDYCARQLVGLGAAGLIAAAIFSRRAAAFLGSPILQFMGRTSYSFYLIHLLVLMGVIRTWVVVAGTASMLPVAAVSLPLTYVLADLMARFVEKPCNEFGRATATKIRSVTTAN
jgi:peptidoglycan/LPS O-acetylase OafA/YrhL